MEPRIRPKRVTVPLDGLLKSEQRGLTACRKCEVNIKHTSVRQKERLGLGLLCMNIISIYICHFFSILLSQSQHSLMSHVFSNRRKILCLQYFYMVLHIITVYMYMYMYYLHTSVPNQTTAHQVSSMFWYSVQQGHVHYHMCSWQLSRRMYPI